MITKGERTELRSIVRNQFKVLRAEVEQRRTEMHAEFEDQIVAHYSADNAKWAGVTHLIHEAVMECNRTINNVLYEQGYQTKGHTERMWVSEPPISPPTGDQVQMRRRATARIQESVKAALLKLDRDEADLLRTLAVGALDSDEAHAFLAAIPTVSELVPTARLAELEASIDAGSDG